jgi:hypothetical protein
VNKNKIQAASMENVVNDVMKDSMRRLKCIAERITDNEEGIDSEILENWKDRILHLSREIALVQYENIETFKVLNSFVSSPELSKQTDGTIRTLKKNLEKAIHIKTSSLDPDLNADVQNIKVILQQSQSTVFGDECECVEVGFGLKDTICPYTLMTFVVPMER